MNLSDALFFLRVLNPRVGLPHGDIGDLRPIGERPSPPPCGDQLGSLQNHEQLGAYLTSERPALPILISSCDSLPT